MVHLTVVQVHVRLKTFEVDAFFVAYSRAVHTPVRDGAPSAGRRGPFPIDKSTSASGKTLNGSSGRPFCTIMIKDKATTFYVNTRNRVITTDQEVRKKVKKEEIGEGKVIMSYVSLGPLNSSTLVIPEGSCYKGRKKDVDALVTDKGQRTVADTLTSILIHKVICEVETLAGRGPAPTFMSNIPRFSIKILCPNFDGLVTIPEI